MSRENGELIFGLSILAGLATGAVLGVLFAPRKGKESRKIICDTVVKFADEKVKSIEKAKEQAIKEIETVQYNIEKALQKINDSLKAKQHAKAKNKEDSVYGV